MVINKIIILFNTEHSVFLFLLSSSSKINTFYYAEICIVLTIHFYYKSNLILIKFTIERKANRLVIKNFGKRTYH
jgi:hypothetical protein